MIPFTEPLRYLRLPDAPGTVSDPVGWQEDGTYAVGSIPDIDANPDAAVKFRGYIEDARPEDLDRLPEGLRSRRVLRCITTTRLRGARNRRHPETFPSSGLVAPDMTEHWPDFILADPVNIGTIEAGEVFIVWSVLQIRRVIPHYDALAYRAAAGDYAILSPTSDPTGYTP